MESHQLSKLPPFAPENEHSQLQGSIFFAVFFLIRQASYFLSDSVIRTVLRYTPSPSIQRLLKISDTMSRRSREIIAERKLALEKGDAALAEEVGEGKDIMSICCAFPFVPMDALLE